MKTLFFSKETPNGEVKGTLIVDGKLIYFKVNNQEYSQQIISQLENKGAIITQGRKAIRINMFPDSLIENNGLVKLADNTFNINEEPIELIEQILFDYFSNMYAKGGFSLDIE